MIRFPVTAEPWKDKIGIFDSFGYWVSEGFGGLEFKPSDKALAERTAALINWAYGAGQADAQQAMRDALGIEQRDD